MSRTFTKLFSSITESTIWCEPAATRLTWITMLAMADRHGRVWASIPGLANRARVTVSEVESALRTFLSPDPYSRTPDNEGRRVIDIDGGWQLLNHAKYRDIRDEETIRESKREHMRRKRAAESTDVHSGTNASTVERGGPNAEADSDADRNQSSIQAPATFEEGARWSPDDSPAWQAFEAHHQQTRKWSLPRAHQAKGQLRAIAKDGGNPEAVLEWALTRGLSDLTDCARRMAADAAKESENAERRRSGESLADASRRITEERKLGPSPTALIPLAGPGNAG